MSKMTDLMSGAVGYFWTDVDDVDALQLFDASRRADWPESRALVGFSSERPTTPTTAPEFAEPGTASRRPWWRFGKTTA